MSALKKQIRDQFRTAVFERDGYRCKFCQRTDDLDAHHITDRNELPAGGYVVENGITLCPEHHLLAERWHTSSGTDVVPGFTPTDLYKKIFSSLERAMTASLTLQRKLERRTT